MGIYRTHSAIRTPKQTNSPSPNSTSSQWELGAVGGHGRELRASGPGGSRACSFRSKIADFTGTVNLNNWIIHSAFLVCDVRPVSCRLRPKFARKGNEYLLDALESDLAAVQHVYEPSRGPDQQVAALGQLSRLVPEIRASVHHARAHVRPVRELSNTTMVLPHLSSKLLSDLPVCPVCL